MNRRYSILASALIAMAIFALGSTAMTTVASAQLDTCCVRIQNNTHCHVTICVRLAGGAVRCTTLTAGQSAGFRFECDDSTRFWVENDACGHDHRLKFDGCVRVHLRGGCCAAACVRRDDDRCFNISINPTDGPCPCPEE